MDTQVSPNRSISIGDAKYVLDGSFSTLRTVQEYFGRDVVQIIVNLMDMRFDEVAKLISIGSGKPAMEIGQSIADNVGALTREYTMLKTHLIAWLNIAITPKAGREKKSAEMQAILDKQANLPSLGTNTSGSPLVSSDGSPVNSGEATSGS